MTSRQYKPTYSKMIEKAIVAVQQLLSTRKPVSQARIEKYIKQNYPVNDNVYKTFVRRALREGTQSNSLVRVRNSFRLSAQSAKKSTRSTPTKRSATPRTKNVEKKQRDSKVARKKVVAAKRIQQDTSAPASASPIASVVAPAVAPVAAKPSAFVAGTKHPFIWQYSENGYWANYKVKASDIVEDVYLNYLANRGDTDVRAVRSGDWEYMVDFMAMKQTNIQHANHTVRNIKRVSNVATA